MFRKYLRIFHHWAQRIRICIIFQTYSKLTHSFLLTLHNTRTHKANIYKKQIPKLFKKLRTQNSSSLYCLWSQHCPSSINYVQSLLLKSEIKILKAQTHFVHNFCHNMSLFHDTHVVNTCCHQYFVNVWKNVLLDSG